MSLSVAARGSCLSWSDRLALLLCLAGFLIAHRVTITVFEAIPHIEDEMAYVWQAQVMARGKLTLPSPPYEKAFLVPFVVDYQGQRFGKYPPGWPAMLSLGVRLGAREWVNPFLAACSLWLLYRLGQRLFGNLVGLLSLALTLTSPFFWMNSASLLSHAFGLFLTLAFGLAWLEAFQVEAVERGLPVSLPTLVGALSIGLLALTRPLTAVGVALPYVIHALWLLWRGNRQMRLRLIGFALLAGGIAALLFLWQYAVSGDPLLNPYTLWWSYDKVGFGPGYGRAEGGHSLHQAWINLKYSLWFGRHDLFGWWHYSWVLLPFGLLGVLWKRRWSALPALMVLPALIFVYLFYWIGSALFGPRYYFEGLHSAVLLSAVGFAWLAGLPFTPTTPYIPRQGWQKARRLIATAGLALVVAANMLFYTPLRLGGMFGLYGVTASRLRPFLSEQAQALTPALVIVHPEHWTEYGALLELSSPFLDSPFIIVRSIGPNTDRALAEAFKDRNILHYYPNDPYRLILVQNRGSD
ncbi:MAG: hypothetical protein DDG59_12720 [Anaerolineae bacterium]|jgi:hypothetical protein|nr:MAG: hypothetical protein DDG59_12720 [Anaerolineae bacterium]